MELYRTVTACFMVLRGRHSVSGNKAYLKKLRTTEWTCTDYSNPHEQLEGSGTTKHNTFELQQPHRESRYWIEASSLRDKKMQRYWQRCLSSYLIGWLVINWWLFKVEKIYNVRSQIIKQNIYSSTTCVMLPIPLHFLVYNTKLTFYIYKKDQCEEILSIFEGRRLSTKKNTLNLASVFMLCCIGIFFKLQLPSSSSCDNVIKTLTLLASKRYLKFKILTLFSPFR